MGAYTSTQVAFRCTRNILVGIEKPGFFEELSGDAKILTETGFLVYSRRPLIAHQIIGLQPPAGHETNLINAIQNSPKPCF